MRQAGCEAARSGGFSILWDGLHRFPSVLEQDRQFRAGDSKGCHEGGA